MMGSRGYRGSGMVDDSRFPYSTLQGLGAGQIVIGLAILAFGVAEIVLNQYFWQTGLVAIWMPVFVVITGAIGASASPSRLYQLDQIKMAFLVMSVLSLLMAIALGVVEGLLHYMWYQEEVWMALTGADGALAAKGGPFTNGMSIYYFVIPLVVLACLEFITALISALVCACCSPLIVESPYSVYGRPMPIPRPMIQPFPAQTPGFAYPSYPSYPAYQYQNQYPAYQYAQAAPAYQYAQAASAPASTYSYATAYQQPNLPQIQYI